jgi:hypothetical protein
MEAAEPSTENVELFGTLSSAPSLQSQRQTRSEAPFS